jgi:hypothetical protein
MFKSKIKVLSVLLVLVSIFLLSQLAGFTSTALATDFSDYYNRIEMFDPNFVPRDYVEEVVYNLTSRFGIRRMGSRNEYNAVKYVESEFQKLGYTDVTVGEFRLTNTITMGALRFSDGGPDIFGNTSATDYNFSGATLVDVGTHLDYSIPDGITGDIVIAILYDNIAIPAVTVPDIGLNAIVADLTAANPDIDIKGVVTARSGATQQTINSMGEAQIRNSNERTVPAALSRSGGLPTITLPRAFFIQAIERADAFSNMHRHSKVGSATTMNNSSWSVYAIKPASTPNPDLVIVVTAHIDTVLASQGASDNAGAVAGVLENARLFLGRDTGNIEIVFSAVGAEEGSSPGFAGSGWVADQMMEKYGRERLININCDMFGSPNRSGTTNISMVNIHNALGGTGASQNFSVIQNNLPCWLILSNADNIPMAPGITNYRLNRYGSTDHVSFQNRNIDGLNIALTTPTNSVEAEYHTAEDTMRCNWMWERCKNATAMITAGIDKAVNIQTSKIARFEIKNSDAGAEVFFAYAERQFKTYSLGVEAVFTDAETDDQITLTFSPGKTAHSLPAGTYTISNVIGAGQGVADHVTREELKFSAVMLAEKVGHDWNNGRVCVICGEVAAIVDDGTSAKGTGTGVSESNATISPSKIGFDLSNSRDISVNITPNGRKINNLKNGAYTLKLGTDYTISGNAVTIKASYLATLPAGAQTIAFEMNGGKNPQLIITVASQLPETEGSLEAFSTFAAFIEGFEDNTFRGNSQITREQFIAILFRLKDPQPTDDPAETSGPSFKDVSPERWSYGDIEWAKEAGIIEADGDGNFRPADPLTRAEMAIMLVKADGLTEMAANTFNDLADHAAKDDILKAVKAKIFTGYPDGSFKPDSLSTRNEAVTALIRYLLGAEPEDAMWQGIELKFSDVVRSHWAYKYVALAVSGH